MDKRSLLIDEAWVQAAVDYLVENSGSAAAAHSNVLRADYKRKQTRAALILAADQPTVAKSEAWAECHPDYVAVCEKHACAVEIDETHRNERNKAVVLIEAWRTSQATLRGLGRMS